MHTDEPPILVDKTIHRRIPLAHGDTDERKSRLRQCAAHEFPVAGVTCGDDRALALGEDSFEMLSSLDLDVICHMAHDDGKAQNLEKHGAETQGTLLGDALRFPLVRPKTHGDLRDRELLSAHRQKRPEGERQSASQTIAKASGQKAGDAAQKAHEVVRHVFASLSLSVFSSCLTFLTRSGRRFIAACMRSHS